MTMLLTSTKWNFLHNNWEGLQTLNAVADLDKIKTLFLKFKWFKLFSEYIFISSAGSAYLGFVTNAKAYQSHRRNYPHRDIYV